MPKGIFTGIGGAARKVKNLYVGVNGAARKVKAGYVGVNGVARKIWPNLAQVTPPANLGTPVIKTVSATFTLTPGTYVFSLAGGGGSSGRSGYSAAGNCVIRWAEYQQECDDDGECDDKCEDPSQSCSGRAAAGTGANGIQTRLTLFFANPVTVSVVIGGRGAAPSTAQGAAGQPGGTTRLTIGSQVYTAAGGAGGGGVAIKTCFPGDPCNGTYDGYCTVGADSPPSIPLSWPHSSLNGYAKGGIAPAANTNSYALGTAGVCAIFGPFA